MSKAALIAVGCAVLAGVLAPNVKADDWDQKTVFTFNVPVEIPGQVLLPGTYVFKLADSQSDRNIVQVFNKDENHLYGTFLDIPDYRLKPRGKPVITFEERPGNSPEAVKAWFYPGENYGHEFVYPKAKAVALAKAHNQPVPSMPTELTDRTTKPAPTLTEPHLAEMKQAPLKAQKPTQEEVAVTEVFVAPPPAERRPVTLLAQNTPPPAAAAQRPTPTAPAKLPHTGSDLPLIGALGLLSLTGALALRLAYAFRS